MALASAAGALLKPQTPLQQLLEDINFQRTKEMRQLLKDDSGFVVLQGTTYWTDLFVRHFLFQTEPVHSIDSDDLLFFVRKKHVKSSSRHMPKYETEVEVFRKDSRKLPIGDPDVDWEETVYLNMVIHQFDYTLTLAICTRTSPKELQVLRRHSQRVYASPSRRKMDTKGEGEEITYPHICFMVDNFDEVFSDILVRDGEMVCVELVANDKDGSVQGVIFLGSIRYDALKKVYDARQSSLSSKVAQRMSFGLFSSGANVQTRCEFVRMKGPQGKGHAEMAVTKPKGSGVETPTSEPGFCATDMWDDWEEENDDYCTYRHQRRLSDPSANLNNFTRYGWRTKASNSSAPDASSAVGGGTCSAAAKARSENEGLDSLASEVSEIEAGDLRDDLRPAFSASEAHLHTNTDASNSPAATSAEATGSPDCGAAAAPIELDEVAVEVANTPADTPAATPTTATAATTPNGGKTTGCSNCFGGAGSGGGLGKRGKKWTQKMDTPEMSEIYCPACDEDMTNATADCLNKMPDKTKTTKPKHRSILHMESEMLVSKQQRCGLKLGEKKILGRSASLGSADKKGAKKCVEVLKKDTKFKTREKEREKEKEKLKEKEKDKLKEKEKDKGKDKEKEKSKTSSLLAKVSPKRMRAIRSGSDKTKSQQQKTSEQKQLKENKENANNNATTTTIRKAETQNTKRSKSPMKPKEAKAPLATAEVLADEQLKPQEYEIADDATSLNGAEFGDGHDTQPKMAILSASDSKLMISVHGTEELPVVEATASPMEAAINSSQTTTTAAVKPPYIYEKILLVPVNSECHPLKELAESDDDTLNTPRNTLIAPQNTLNAPISTLNAITPAETNALDNKLPISTSLTNDCNGNQCATAEKITTPDKMETTAYQKEQQQSSDEADFVAINRAGEEEELVTSEGEMREMQVLRKKRSAAAQKEFYNRAVNLVPKRRTPDGTNIYYWCDLTKQALKELDDGAYNPLWASRGFTQTFHFWKENRRQQSTPLNAFLTYVTLPWWSIAKDLLDHRETPILTF